MEYIKQYSVLILLFLPIFCLADGWKKSPTGLEYKFHIQNNGANPKLGDIVILDMQYGIEDSVLFDSRKMPGNFEFPLQAPQFEGDIFEGIAMMSAGDSASFRIKADSFFLVSMRAPSLPPNIAPGSDLIFNIKLKDFQSQKERERAQAQELENKRKNEKTILKQYLADNDIKMLPNPSGLYYIETEKGAGKKPKAGDSVYVHYTGKLLDGSVFDSSLKKAKPFVFTLGAGQVIPGWDEGVSLMRVGGKAIMIIPSGLAYGSRDLGVIPPYSTLVFEVELVEIK